ncbi:ROK family transcriptional regulator [Streptomyces sp. MP131-18]|uniref:ROK family transcriptional regulator n=1 Tax=Streptomyces sp. MP131-18 TaxID=1857892 RepID=UPI00097BFF19|nr:ROK family transcriptional regulator [Streptomyces sp. MP131-18]ONK09959.1 N-acetylglucosamine repressor [Streptomyces sp. MP131-18]
MSGPAGATPHASSRAAVLDVIRAAGTISRVGLVKATGFTGATISTVVRRLIDDGLVLETGRAESTGGKRRVLLQLNQSSRFAVGVHLDHAGLTYVLTNLGGSVVARMSRAGVGADDPPVVVARIATEVDALIDGAGIDRSRILGLGLVAPGPLNQTGGMPLTPPAMRHWKSFPLDRELGTAVGLPVVLDNDATAAALGEHWSGDVGGTATFAAIYMGTGIGAGLMINGVTYRGAGGNAGEIGHICLDVAGPDCWCGARGCTEQLAGPGAVVGAALADADLTRSAGLASTGERPRRVADFAAITRAALRGDQRARALLERSARYLAVAARTLANVMDLEQLVLTGPSLAIAGSIYLPVVQEELDRAFFSRATHSVPVRLSRSAATAPAIGAAALVLQSELVPLREGLRLPDNLGDAEPTGQPAAH